MTDETKTGRVTLVGAGPGDPGLMTLAGKSALEQADVILYDRLVGREILAMMPGAAIQIDVGKNKGSHPVPQDEINRLIANYALAGKNVVRLKGGDPYLFGRGAEELDHVAGLGIPFRVVPGVTSAIAAPAYAGIPVTHREFSSSLHILTGHGKNDSPPDIPYGELVRLRGTLVFLMGLSAAETICRGLIDAGMPPETPAAVVENGTRDDQRRLAATVADLPRLARENAFSSPALLVVGAVCALAERYDWKSRLPLWGKRMLVASSQATGGRLAVGLREYGCAVDEYAGIRMQVAPLSESLWRDIERYAWIVFTSPFGAETFFSEMKKFGVDVRLIAGAKFAVVGGRTERVLRDRGVYADLKTHEYNGKTLAERLAATVGSGERALLFRARDGGRDLPDILAAAGIAFDDVTAYHTLKNPPDPDILANLEAGRYTAAAFTSASSVEAMAWGDLSGIRAYCIGEMTAAAAAKHGMAVEVSREASIESMVDLIVRTERADRQ